MSHLLLLLPLLALICPFFFFNDTATTEIYTLSLHDALPILVELAAEVEVFHSPDGEAFATFDVEYHRETWAIRTGPFRIAQDRKSTRLNSSHVRISYAVFCLKKKKTPRTRRNRHTSEPRPGS